MSVAGIAGKKELTLSAPNPVSRLGSREVAVCRCWRSVRNWEQKKAVRENVGFAGEQVSRLPDR